MLEVWLGAGLARPPFGTRAVLIDLFTIIQAFTDGAALRGETDRDQVGARLRHAVYGYLRPLNPRPR